MTEGPKNAVSRFLSLLLLGVYFIFKVRFTLNHAMVDARVVHSLIRWDKISGFAYVDSVRLRIRPVIRIVFMDIYVRFPFRFVVILRA